MPRAVLLGTDPRKKLNGFINLKGGQYAELFDKGLDGLGKIFTTDRIATLIDRRIQSADIFEHELRQHWTEWFETVESFLLQTAASGAKSVDDARVAMVTKQQRPHPAREGVDDWLNLHRSFLIGHFGRQSGQALEAILRQAAANDQYGSGTVARDLRGVIQLRPAQANRIAQLYMADRENGLTAKEARKRAAQRTAKGKQERINTVAQHEVAQMWNRGALEAVKEAVAKGDMDPDTTKVWLTVGDDRVCPICGPLHELELELDEPYESIRGFKDQSPPAHIRCRCALAFKRPPKKRKEEEEEEEERFRVPVSFVLVGGATLAAAGVLAAGAARALSAEFSWLEYMTPGWQFADVEGAEIMVLQGIEAAERRKAFEEAIQLARERHPITDTTIKLGELLGTDTVGETKPGIQLMARMMRSRTFDEEAGKALRSAKFTAIPSLWFNTDGPGDMVFGLLQLRWRTARDPDVLTEMAALYDTTEAEALRFLDLFQLEGLPRESVSSTDLFPRFMAAEGIPIDHPSLGPIDQNDTDAFVILSKDRKMFEELVGGGGGFAPLPLNAPDSGYTLYHPVLQGQQIFGFRDMNTEVHQLSVKLKPGSTGIARLDLADISSKMASESRTELYDLLTGTILDKETLVRFKARYTLGPGRVNIRILNDANTAIRGSLDAGLITREQAEEMAERVAMVFGRTEAVERLAGDDAALARIMGFDYVFDGPSRTVVNPAALHIDPFIESYLPEDWNSIFNSWHIAASGGGLVPTNILDADLVHRFNLSYNNTYLVNADGEDWFVKAVDRVAEGVESEIQFSQIMNEMAMDHIVMPMGAADIGRLSENGLVIKLAPSHIVLSAFAKTVKGAVDKVNAVLTDAGLVDMFQLRTVEHVLGASDRHAGQYGITSAGRLLGFDYEAVSFTYSGDAGGNALDALIPFSRINDVIPPDDAIFILEDIKDGLNNAGFLTGQQLDRIDEMIEVFELVNEFNSGYGDFFADIGKIAPEMVGHSGAEVRLWANLWENQNDYLQQLRKAMHKVKHSATATADTPIPGTTAVSDVLLDRLRIELRGLVVAAPGAADRGIELSIWAAQAASDANVAQDLFHSVQAVALRHVALRRMEMNVARDNLRALSFALHDNDADQTLRVIARDWGVPQERLVYELIEVHGPGALATPSMSLLRLNEALSFGGNMVQRVEAPEFKVLSDVATWADVRVAANRAVALQWDDSAPVAMALTPRAQIAKAQEVLLGLRTLNIDVESDWNFVQKMAREVATGSQPEAEAAAGQARKIAEQKLTRMLDRDAIDYTLALGAADNFSALQQRVITFIPQEWRIKLDLAGGDLDLPPRVLIQETAVPSANHFQVKLLREALGVLDNNPWATRSDILMWISSRAALGGGQLDERRFHNLLPKLDALQTAAPDDYADVLAEALIAADRFGMVEQVAFAPADGMGPLRFLLRDGEWDADVAMTRAWKDALPLTVRQAISDGQVAGLDLAPYSEEWMLTKLVSDMEPLTSRSDERLAELQLLMASRTLPNDFEQVEFIYDLKTLEEGVATAIQRGMTPVELSVWLAGHEGSVTRKLAFTLGQTARTGLQIPLDLRTPANRAAIRNAKMRAEIDMSNAPMSTVQGQIGEDTVRRIMNLYATHHQLRDLAPVVVKMMRTGHLRARIPGDVLTDLRFAEVVIRNKMVFTATELAHAKRAAFQLATLQRHPTLPQDLREAVAEVAVDADLRLSQFAEMLNVPNMGAVGIKQVMRQGLMDDAQRIDFAKALNHAAPNQIEASLVAADGVGVDMEALYKHINTFDIKQATFPYTTEERVSFLIGRDRAMEFLNGRFGLGRLTDVQEDIRTEFAPRYPFIDILHPKAEVAVAKAWGDLALASFDTPIKRELALQLLTAANNATDLQDKRSYVARYLVLKDRITVPTEQDIVTALRNGDIYEIAARFVSLNEHARRQRLPRDRMDKLLDLIEAVGETHNTTGIVKELQQLANGAILGSKKPGQGFDSAILDLAAFKEAPGSLRAFPEPDSIDLLIPDAGIWGDVAHMKSHLEARIDHTSSFSSIIANGDEAMMLMEQVEVAGQLPWEREFFRQWSGMLGRERALIPLFEEAQAARWYQVLDDDEEAPDMQAIAARIRRMLPKEPAAVEVTVFERFLEGRAEGEWVPMLNSWIEEVNGTLAIERSIGPLDNMLPGGEAWHLAGLGVDPKVRHAIQLFVSSEVSSGRIDSQAAAGLLGKLEGVTDGAGMIQVWLDAHAAARVKWPEITGDQIAQLRAMHRMRDMARRVVLLAETQLGHRLNTIVITGINTALDDGDHVEVRRILNNLIFDVNSSLGLAA